MSCDIETVSIDRVLTKELFNGKILKFDFLVKEKSF